MMKDFKERLNEMIYENHEAFIKALFYVEKGIENPVILNQLYRQYMDHDDIQLLNPQFEEWIQNMEFTPYEKEVQEIMQLRENLIFQRFKRAWENIEKEEFIISDYSLQHFASELNEDFKERWDFIPSHYDSFDTAYAVYTSIGKASKIKYEVDAEDLIDRLKSLNVLSTIKEEYPKEYKVNHTKFKEYCSQTSLQHFKAFLEEKPEPLQIERTVKI